LLLVVPAVAAVVEGFVGRTAIAFSKERGPWAVMHICEGSNYRKYLSIGT